MIRWPFYRRWENDAEPASAAAFKAWDHAQRQELGWRAGLRINRASNGIWQISRHWPHLLCWSWSVCLERRSSFGWRQWVPLIVQPGFVAVGVWWSIALRWQPYSYMGGTGQYANHPRVAWKHAERAAGGEG